MNNVKFEEVVKKEKISLLARECGTKAYADVCINEKARVAVVCIQTPNSCLGKSKLHLVRIENDKLVIKILEMGFLEKGERVSLHGLSEDGQTLSYGVNYGHRSNESVDRWVDSKMKIY